MKEKDLQFPTSWEDRQVLIRDRVWYVPLRIKEQRPFNFPGWDHAELFDNTNPVCIEYCSGNGSWIASKAEQHPNINWVAVEMKFDRVRKTWSKIKRKSLQNLMIVCGEAYNATHLYFPSNSISAVYINFPDPWPKHRHYKNRLIQKPFLEELYRILQNEKELTFVTDDSDYSEWTIKKISCHPGFATEYPFPYYINEYPEYGTSYFEQLWRDKGKIIRYHRFKKMDQMQ